MGWEAQVLTPCPAYPRKPRPRLKSAMIEYSLRTKQTLQSGPTSRVHSMYTACRSCAKAELVHAALINQANKL